MATKLLGAEFSLIETNATCTQALLTFSFLQAGTGTGLSDGQVVMFRKIFHNAELQRHLLRSFFSSTLTFFIYNHYGSNFSFLPMISGLS